MSGTYTVVVGNKGRLVVPAEIRERVGLDEGTVLVMFDTPSGMVLVTQEQLRDQVRADLAGSDLASELLMERRAAAEREDQR
jgi:AbrB family looped-hinge helix DNA binding protein